MTVILYQKDARGVAYLTLDRPQAHNAFDEGLIEAVTDAFQDIATSSHVRLVVLQAAGSSFCAGADLEWMRRAAHYDLARNRQDAQALALMFAEIDSCPKPVIAAVHGAAYGGGVGLVACADVAIATRRATFRLSEVQLGLIPATISPYLVRAMGLRAARRYALTAERFDADEAYRVGLVHEVVADEAALAQAVAQTVNALLANAPHAMAQTKALLERVADHPLGPELSQATAEAIALVRASPEGREGVAAFLDKRPPDWQHAPG